MNRPRCEMWPVFVILRCNVNHIHNKRLDRVVLGNTARFFVPSQIWPFLGVFRAFRRLGGTSYRPGRKSVLNRKFAENNFFGPQT